MDNKKISGLLLGLALLPAAAGADGYVIAHPSVTVAAGEVREIYVGNMQFAGSAKLVPVDNAALQQDFLAKVVKADADRYATIWTKKSFREGLTAPAMKSGDAEVLDFVKKTPGAVGYVSVSPTGVNVVSKY